MEPYVGVQVGFSRYDGPVGVSSDFLAAPGAGLRLRLGSLGGAYGDASYLLNWGADSPLPVLAFI